MHHTTPNAVEMAASVPEIMDSSGIADGWK
jgi:hypothetical protein